MMEVLGTIAIGAVVGVLSGLFGVGGGFLLSPLLNVVFGIPMSRAVGSTAGVVLGVATSSMAARWRQGVVDLQMVLTLAGGMLPGLFAGLWILESIKASTTGSASMLVDQVLLGLFVLVLVSVGSFMLWDYHRGGGRSPEKRVGAFAHLRIPPYVRFDCLEEPRLSLPALSYYGLAVGLVFGLMSIGGVILVPTLVYWVGLRTHKAVAVAVSVTWLLGIVGTAAHAWNENLDLRLVAALLVGGTLGAQLGWRWNRRISGPRLRHYFAVLVLVTAAVVGWKLGRLTL